MTRPTPFTIDVPQGRLDAIRAKVRAFDWDQVPDAGAWSAGVGIADLRRLTEYWLERYDWRAREAALNALPQYTATVSGQLLHYVQARGNGSRPPIVLIHGWPGSFIEFARLVDPLVQDGHDVIVPSLPGFGFSGRPAEPIGPRATAGLFHRLLTETLGYQGYCVQGGDWGAAVGGWLAHDHPQSCKALHLNMVLIQASDAMPTTPDEVAWAEARARLNLEEGGYSHLQQTRPQTLGFAMSESPVGVAAWILEKFGVWSDVPKRTDGTPDLWAAFDEDLLLTNIMLYVATGSFVTSTWMYRGRKVEGSNVFPAGAYVHVPTGVAAFPDPVFPPPPRSHAEKSYHVTRWTKMPRGGHFPALEQPDHLLADLRAFLAG
ncbi:MAG: epoxide hydrolase family protein [Microvirga sp.]